MRNLTLHILLLACCCSCALTRGGRQQDLVASPGAPPARLLATIPFQQYTGGVLVIRGRVNDFPDSLHFILDTGSGGISLDSTTCARMGLAVTPSDKVINGIGGTRPLSFARGNTLKLPGLQTDSLDFHINDYQFISSVYGVWIDGIIGYSFLARYIVRIDYDSMKLFVYSPGRYVYERGGELLNPALHYIPTIPAPLKNQSRYQTRYYFDIGAGLCLMLSNRFVQDSCLFCEPRQRRHKFIQTEAQGLLGKTVMTLTAVQELQVGSYRFRNVPTYLFDDLSNVTYYPYLGGLVGNDLLRRFNVTLNYPDKQIYIIPNTHFTDRFDYSYTGLVMYFIDGHVTVTDVMAGSPAERAGFKPGDIIVSVGSNFSNDIQVYRELLKSVGSRVQVIVMREGALLDMKLSIKSIL